MLRIISVSLITLMLAATAADARTRVRVTKYVERPIAEHPYAVNFVLAAILCAFAAYSVPPGQQAGQCPPRADVTPYGRRRA